MNNMWHIIRVLKNELAKEQAMFDIAQLAIVKGRHLLYPSLIDGATESINRIYFLRQTINLLTTGI